MSRLLGNRVLVLILGVWVAQAGNKAFGESLPAVDTFSHGPGETLSYSLGGDGSEYIVGRNVPLDTDPDAPDYQIAVPFIPDVSGEIVQIDLAFIHAIVEPDTVWRTVHVYIYKDPPGTNGPGFLGSPPLEVWNCTGETGCVYQFSEDDPPHCDAQCSPLPATLEPYRHLRPASPDPQGALTAGQRYWLIVMHRYPATGNTVNYARWYWNDHGVLPPFSSVMHRLAPGTDGIGATDDWVVIPGGQMPAFRILVESADCAVPAVPTDTNCAEVVQPPTGTDSVCWWSDPAGHSTMPNHGLGRMHGFPLNLSLWQGFGPSDFAPPSLDPVASSSPLVSKGVAHYAGPSPFQTRPMHNNLVDLITGQSLLRSVDFELPFGGAVFRHVRTYSENSSQFPGSSNASYTGEGPSPPEGTFWDWNGQFWMMSENPILLIDASYSDEFRREPIIHPDKKRCYFIPDAHHAIPFLWDEHTRTYVAPSWFDARLECSGEVDAQGHPRPLHYYVWLHRRSVKYTFEAHYEDVWTLPNGVNAHDAPNFVNGVNPGGMGIPYYGIVKQIEDNYGNRVEYGYCNFRQSEPETPTEMGNACRKCAQNCNEKGQISHIKLITKDPQTQQDRTVWTLVYTHRAFPIVTDPFYTFGSGGIKIPRQFKDSFQQHAVHTIHVYEGAPNDLPTECLTLSSDAFCSAHSLSSLDQVNHTWVMNHPEWVMEARYLYSENGYVSGYSESANEPSHIEDLCQSARLFAKACPLFEYSSTPDTAYYGSPHPYCKGMRLVKSTVTRKSETGVLDTKWKLYRDEKTRHDALNRRNNELTLKCVWDSATVDKLVQAHREATNNPGAGPNFILEGRHITGEPSESTSELYLAQADVVFSDYAKDPQPPYGLREVLVNDFIHSDIARTGPNMLTRRSSMADFRAGAKDNGWYHYYYYVQYPQSAVAGTEGWDPNTFYPSLTYHFPFRLIPPAFSAPPTGGIYKQPPLDSPYFITVVDEQEYDKATMAPKPYDPITRLGLRTRRVVQMNPAGFMLKDQTWNFETGEQTATGLTEEFVRDARGRMVQRRTLGWSAANLPGSGTTGENDGLIYEYKYAPDGTDYDNVISIELPGGGIQQGLFNTKPGELIAEGIRKGTGGEFLYTTLYERGVPEQPELITRTVQFPNATANPDTGNGEVVTTHYLTVPSDSGGNPRVVEKVIVRPPAPTMRGGQPAYPVEKFHYDNIGNLDWHGIGLLNGAEPTSTPFYFIMETTQRDDHGRVLAEITDVPASYSTAPPAGWSRVSPLDALNLTTSYSYDSMFGLSRIIHPNLRETRIVHRFRSEGDGIEQWTFTDLLNNGGDYTALSPVRIVHSSGGRVISERTAKVAIVDQPDGEGELVEDIAVVTPQYDSHGRLVGSSQAGADQSTVSSNISYDGFGNVGRVQKPDGTITRNVYDKLGRLERIYRGTDDRHEYWSTARACAPDEDPQQTGCFPDGQFPDNLVLIEKRYYGLGITNAGQMVESRHYRERPLNQYHLEVPEGIPNPPPPPPENNEDEIGSLTRYTYDWRMRPVEAKNENAAGQALTHSLTWLDNLGRTRFAAEYGDTILSSSTAPHPAALGAAQALPTAAAILATTPKPIALTENIYNARGQVEESRQYFVADASGATYTSTFTYYDHQGKTLEVIAPNSPIRRYAYDAKGRQVSSSSWAAGVELSRTETTFDADDRAITSTTFERRHDQLSTGPITETNCVKSYRHSWYDLAGRVIATVDYGTNSATGIFKTGDKPNRSTAAPVVEDLDHRVLAAKYTDVPPPAQLTAYRYDDKGRQVAVFHPDHSTTRYEYDDLGRMTAKYENADATDPNLVQIIRYVFDTSGRVTMMIADRPEGQFDQETQIEYGAPVISQSDGSVISANNSWISVVHFPNPADGKASETDTLRFTYYSDGSVATRTDSRGIVFHHTYDELGRRIETTIDDSAWFTPPEEGHPDTRPAGRISRITYQYLPSGQLEFVTAYTREKPQESAERILCQSKFEYDLRQHLTREWQSHGGPVSGSTPYVSYDWIQSPATEHNFDRLSGMQYPPRIGETQRRIIVHQCGDDAGDADSLAGRTTLIADTISGASAGYSYAGLSRRISMSYGNGVFQSFAKGQEYGGLDLFGRVKELDYVTASATVQAFEYGYDLAGNRTFARVRQWPTGTPANPVPHVNDRSYLYTYDSLNRLIDARFGELNATNTAIVQGTGGAGNPPIPAGFTWHLDNLGNWAGDSEHPGLLRTGDFDGNGTVDSHSTTHAVNQANQIESVAESGYPHPTFNDPGGNQVLIDDKNYCQFDAFNRLIQVNNIGTAQIDPATGRVVSGQLGDFIARYAYDGLGRLIRKQNPVSTGQTYLQTRDLYYDGSRRIQEVILRPDVNLAGHLIGGKENNDLIAKFDVDGDGIPDLEQPDVFIINDAGMAFLLEAGAGQRWTDREYVYGPDDVDEFLAQIDDQKRVTYILQDANLNVMALTAGNSPGGPTNWGGAGQAANGGYPARPATGQVVQQFYYEPYGAAKGVESFFDYAANRIGHQGLFFERFDGDYTKENLTAAAAGLYYNRNRWYSPTLGRFVSRDPNETALPLITALAMNGESLFLSFGAFDADGMYGDGMNPYQYQSSNPINTRDPLGLYDEFDDGMDDFDDAMDDFVGHRIAALGYIAEASGFALMGMNAAAGLLGGMLGVDLLQSAGDILEGKGDFWDYLEVAQTVLPVGKMAGLVAKGAKRAIGRAWAIGSHMADRLGNSRLISRLGRTACFLPGTLVALAPYGFKPIEDIVKGEFIWTSGGVSIQELPAAGVVLDVFSRQTSAIVAVEIVEKTNTCTLWATPEHPFYVNDTESFVRARDIKPGMSLHTIDGSCSIVRFIQIFHGEFLVWNIEVDQSHDFYVTPDPNSPSVLVHNTSRLCKWPGWLFFESQAAAKRAAFRAAGIGKHGRLEDVIEESASAAGGRRYGTRNLDNDMVVWEDLGGHVFWDAGPNSRMYEPPHYQVQKYKGGKGPAKQRFSW